MVIRPREVDQSVTWSGNHHRPSVAGCVACDWSGQLNKIKRIEPHTYVHSRGLVVGSATYSAPIEVRAGPQWRARSTPIAWRHVVRRHRLRHPCRRHPRLGRPGPLEPQTPQRHSGGGCASQLGVAVIDRTARRRGDPQIRRACPRAKGGRGWRAGGHTVGRPCWSAGGRSMIYLNCPRCGLSLRERRLSIERSRACPRCAGRKQLDIPMFRSSKPIRLGGSDRADDHSVTANSSATHIEVRLGGPTG